MRLASSDASGLLEASAACDGRLERLQRRLAPIVAESDGDGSTARAYAAFEILGLVRQTQADNAGARAELMGQVQLQGASGTTAGLGDDDLGILPALGLVAVLKILAGLALVTVTVSVIARLYDGFARTARQENAVAALERIDSTPGLTPAERQRRRKAVLGAMRQAKGAGSPWPWVLGVIGAAAAAAWVGTRASQGRPVFKANPAQLGLWDPAKTQVAVKAHSRGWPT